VHTGGEQYCRTHGRIVGQHQLGDAGVFWQVGDRGIAQRAFERRFQLADHVEVTGATLKNGLLHIDLKRNVPEELKPRKITIAAAPAQAKQIEANAA
jgi:molecular chaperone IbpA